MKKKDKKQEKNTEKETFSNLPKKNIFINSNSTIASYTG